MAEGLNLDNPTDVNRLMDVVERSRYEMGSTLDKRRILMEQYGDEVPNKPQPVNWNQLAVTTLTRYLVAGHPRVYITARNRELARRARKIEDGVNEFLERADLKRHLGMAALDAMFGPSFLKLAADMAGDERILDREHPGSSIFMQALDLDDVVVDMAMSDFADAKLVGDRIWPELAWLKGRAKTDSTYDREAIARLRPEEKGEREADDEGQQRASYIKRRNKQALEPNLYEIVQLWDLYLPRERKLVTVSRQPASVIRVVPWSGPAHGPYHRLVFRDMPHYPLGLSPIAIAKHLWDALNAVQRKLDIQAKNLKTLTAVDFTGEGTKDVEALNTAGDGQGVALHNLANVKPIKHGAISPELVGITGDLNHKINWFLGNISQIAGLGPQTETVGQELQLGAQAGQMAEDMVGRLNEFARRIIVDLVWHLMNADEDIEFAIDRQLQELERFGSERLLINSKFRPAKYRRDFINLNFKIVHHSLQEKGPDQRLQAVIQFIQILGQLAPFGNLVNIPALAELMARLSGIPEFLHVLNVPTAPEMIREPEQGQQGEQRSKRVYERISRSGETGEQAYDQNLAKSMFGGERATAEVAA